MTNINGGRSVPWERILAILVRDQMLEPGPLLPCLWVMIKL